MIDNTDNMAEIPQENLVSDGAVPRGVSVVVPCHNEEDAIAGVLDALQTVMEGAGRPYEIIVVDDGSTDQTAGRIDEKRFRLIRLETNRGYGAALKAGVRAAKYDLLAITDADGTYPNDQLPLLIEKAEDADMVVGARSGTNVNTPWARRPAKWALTRLAQTLCGRKIPDLNSGLRVIRRELWRRFEWIFPDGFSLTSTITLAALTNGYRVKYVPIDYHARIGRSKINPIRDPINFVILIVRTVLYFEPLKVFVPLALALFAASALVGFISLGLSVFWKIGQFMDVTTVLLFVSGLQVLAIGALADMIRRRMGEK